MRKNLKKLFYLSLSLFGLVFAACELQEDTVENHNHKQKLKMYEKRFEELMTDGKFANSFNKIPKSKKSISSSTMGRTVMEEEYGFTIADKAAQVIEEGSKISYTFLITRDSTIENSFENLVIQTDSMENTKAVVIKYNVTSEIIPTGHNSFSFEYSKEITPIVYNNELVETSKELYIECVDVMNTICCQDWDNAGAWGQCHIATWQCFNTEYGLWFISASISTTCSGGGGGSGTGGGGTGGSGGGGSGSTDPINTNPNLPEYEEENIIHENNCEKLKKLIETSVANPVNPFKEALEQNQHDAENANFEKGYKLTYSPTTDSFNIAAAPNNATNCSQINFIPSANMAGIFHSHPVSCGLSEMFSHKDVILLYKTIISHNFGNPTYTNGTAVDYSNFVITVATGFGTYALKIKDWNIFKTQMENILSSKRNTETFFSKFQIMQKKGQFDSLGNDISTAGKSEKNMLEMISSLFGSGISLYKADANFTAWSRLENENNLVTPKPCN